MKAMILTGSLAAVLLGIAPPEAAAQRGAGEPSGVARQAIQPEVVTLEGRLKEIRTAPCEATTGRALVGTHLLLETPSGETLNIHLGPAAAVAETVGKLPVGENVSIEAFRTDRLKPESYVARAIDVAGTRIELRDASLRPTWAGGSARFAASPGTAPGPAFQAGGRGPCGRGWAQGPGGGFGRGRGRGMGPGGGRWR